MSKYESILYLKSPKLLSNIITYSNTSQYNLNVQNLIEQNESYLVKNEKNAKSNYKEIDFIENKKNKNKKKVRSKVYLDKNIAHIKEDLDFNESNSDLLIRNSKTLKSRKNHKNKNLVQAINNKELFSKDIYLDDLLTVQELAFKLHVSTADIIKWLFLQGISVTINQSLDLSISMLVAKHYSFNVLQRQEEQKTIISKQLDEQEGVLRAPVVTLLGHVDHGKTSLLRAIRQDKNLIKEAGNITQTIGSYEVLINHSSPIDKLIFLDTPGHEAFFTMRERGANTTDIVVLVIAADDGLKPQTIEAIKHINNKQLPFIIAINKVDKLEANIDKLKKQLSEFQIDSITNPNCQQIIEVSALSGYNVDVLLSALINCSKVYQWKSNLDKKAEGTILEAYLNKKKGPIAQLLIKNGTLYLGDFVVAGNFYGKVKAIYNGLNKQVNYVKSTALAEVLCFPEVPTAGLSFTIVKNEKEAKALSMQYSDSNNGVSILNNRISLDDISHKSSKIIRKQLNLIIKTNTKGSIDAIVYALSRLPQEKVQINLIMASCGEVSLKDIELAMTSNSVILVFCMNLSTSILQYANKKFVFLKSFPVIYDLIDCVKQQMLEFVDIEYSKNILGQGEVKNLFVINKGVVAGCLVRSGKLKKKAYFELTRDNQRVYIGLIDSLKRIKEDVEEVNEGNECGVLCQDYTSWLVGDYIECYELKPLKKTL